MATLAGDSSWQRGSRERLANSGGGCGDLTEHRNMLDISGFLVRCRKLVHLRGAGRVDPAGDEVWVKRVQRRSNRAKAAVSRGGHNGQIESAERRMRISRYPSVVLDW